MTLPRTDIPRFAADPLEDATSPARIAPPNAVDVVWRATAIWVTWMKARYGTSDALREVADDLRVQKYLTSYEERYMRDDRPATAADAAFGSRILRAWTLFWAAGILPGLHPAQYDAAAQLRSVVEGRSPEDLVYEARLRPQPSILAEAESWQMDAHLNGLDHNYRPYPNEASTPYSALRSPAHSSAPLSAAVEPCIALGWLLGRFAADESPEPEGVR